MSDYNLSFQGLVKWQSDLDWGIFISIDKLSLDVFSIFDQELDHTNLERLSFGDVHAFLVIGLDSDISI
jgi:hypothetical protein